MIELDWRKIELENPGFTIRSVCFLGEGWTSRSYLVNDELVFRFPKRAEDWQELEREIIFLKFAASKLPLAVPEYVQVVTESPAAAHGYAVYRYMRGRALEVKMLTEEKRAASADLLAAFLQTLHSLQPSHELSSLLPKEDARTEAEYYLAQAEREIMPKLPPPEAKAMRDQFEMYLGQPRNFSFQPVVLHADLSGDHIMVEDDLVTGVIDFGDVSWGDADYDFMYLFVDFGQEFVKDVARRYGHQDLEKLGDKLRYFGLVDQIDTILHGAGRALEGQQEAAWHRLKQLLREQKIDI